MLMHISYSQRSKPGHWLEDMFNGTALVSFAGDLVIVTVNYRLGILGKGCLVVIQQTKTVWPARRFRKVKLLRTPIPAQSWGPLLGIPNGSHATHNDIATARTPLLGECQGLLVPTSSAPEILAGPPEIMACRTISFIDVYSLFLSI